MIKGLLFGDDEPPVPQGLPRRPTDFSPLRVAHAADGMACHPGALPLFEANRPDMVHLQAMGKQDRFPFWMDRQASAGPLDEVVE